MTKPIDRAALKAQTRELLQTAQVSPKGMTALYCICLFLLSLMEALFPGPELVSTFLSILTTLAGWILAAGFALYCMDIRRRERSEYAYNPQNRQALLGLFCEGLINHAVLLRFEADDLNVLCRTFHAAHGDFNFHGCAGAFTVLFPGVTANDGTNAAEQRGTNNSASESALCDSIAVLQQLIVNDVGEAENMRMLFTADSDRGIPQLLILVNTEHPGYLLCNRECG